MTDEEKIDAVTAKLTGQLCVGARVRYADTMDRYSVEGTITYAHAYGKFSVRWDNGHAMPGGKLYEYKPDLLVLV